MKNKKYTFGDITFEIEASFDLKEDDRFEPFCSDADTDCLIRVRIDETIEKSSRRFERDGNVITVYVQEKYTGGVNIASLLSSYEGAYIFPKHDAFILHASYVIYNGKAILFTAPSGTGKSTHAEFWRKERGADIINGDRVLVTRRDGRFFANGIYASGNSGICKNQTAPVDAVVLLEQGESNMISNIPKRMLFLRVLCECSYDMNDAEQYERITELVSDMMNLIPVVCYRCKKTPDSVDALERILWNKI